MIAQTGMARAIYPVHAPMDGDVVFAAATGEKPIDPLFGLTELGMLAANTLARLRSTSVADLRSLHRSPLMRSETSNRKAARETLTC